MNMTHCKSLFSFIRQRAENDAALWQMVQRWNECLNGTLNSAKMKAMLILYTRKDDNEIILEGGDATEADLEAEGW